jgi:HAD superfamily hydrolase (TIGR01549 family)
MLDKITLAIDNHDVISFDIFDTLIVRPYVNPYDMFVHLEKIYRLEGFAKARGKAELCARRKTKREEITYDEIYSEIDAAFKSMYTREIELEKQVLRANPDIQAYFRYAAGQNKKIVIISDMYLPKQIIEDILISNNYTGYDKAYISSDCFLTKHSGNLFSFVLKDLNIPPQNLLHIGDNYYSDFLIARKNGIHAICRDKIRRQLFCRLKNARKFYTKNNRGIGASVMMGSLAFWYMKNSADMNEQNYFRNFGYIYGGPAILAYTEWLKNRIRDDNISDVLFLARDGYILKKVFEMITNNSVNTAYVYAPRLISVLFLVNYGNKDFFDQIGLSGMKKILRFYKNKDAELSLHTPDDDNITFDAAKEFIQKNIALYMRLAEKEKTAYYKYITANIQGKKIAVVDSLTEKYSAQRLLQELLLNDNVGVKGYYWYMLKDYYDTENMNVLGGGGVDSGRKTNRWCIN